MNCKNCNGYLILDRESNEFSCENCGMVVNDRTTSESYMNSGFKVQVYCNPTQIPYVYCRKRYLRKRFDLVECNVNTSFDFTGITWTIRKGLKVDPCFEFTYKETFELTYEFLRKIHSIHLPWVSYIVRNLRHGETIKLPQTLKVHITGAYLQLEAHNKVLTHSKKKMINISCFIRWCLERLALAATVNKELSLGYSDPLEYAYLFPEPITKSVKEKYYTWLKQFENLFVLDDSKGIIFVL